MDRLNYDCLGILFENFTDEPGGCSLLYSCAMLNRKVRTIATCYLYRDPWKHWLYQSKDKDLSRQLMDTYMLCYNAIKSGEEKNYNNSLGFEGGEGGEGGERPTKRMSIAIYNNGSNHDDNQKFPLYDYISIARNLHVPSLYHCVKSWYKWNKYKSESESEAWYKWNKFKEGEDEDTEEDNRPIFENFLKIYELFLDRAHIRDCTFAESTEDFKYPITMNQLDQLINSSRKVDLQYLNLGFFQCDSDGLSRITGNCNNLKTFKVSAKNCSDVSLSNFVRSQNRLTKLKIRNAEKIDLTLDALRSQSNSLVKLRILNSNLESCLTPFNGIAACSKLRSIYMRKTDWPVDLSPSILLLPIAKNCEFHNVDFSCTYLPVDILYEIARKSSTTLRRVHLVRPDMSQKDHERYNLSIGIKALANHARNLFHFERDISPGEIDAMNYLLNSVGNSLIRLEIESKLMENVDASHLIATISLCPNLEVLNINHFNFTSSVFKKLIEGCKLLTSLSICNSTSVTDTILNIIRENCNENLKYLDILACSQVSEDAVEELRAEKVSIVEITWSP